VSATIGGVNVDGYTVPGSTNFDSQLGSRAKGGMLLIVPSSDSYRPVKGSEIRLFNPVTDETAFGGIVFEVKRTVHFPSGDKFFSLVLTDYNVLADRRRMFGKLTATTSGAVVQWIIDNYLAEFGVTAGTIEAGTAIAEVRYNGQSPTEGLNELAKIDGYTWDIDAQKRLSYVSRESNAAPFDLSPSYCPVHSLETVDTLEGFRNRQFLRGSQNSITDLRTESIVGDGARREHKVRYKMASDVAITLNGTPVTVGIRGLSSGKDFYWKESEDLITQDEAGTVLTASDTLAVTYRGYYPLFVQMDDPASIAERAAAEGTSGLYEALVEDSSCQYLDLALDKAETLVRQNAFDKVDVAYSTDVPGLRAGMVQTIDLPDYEVDATILITSVTASEMNVPNSDGTDELVLRYTVSGVSGEKADDWLEFYRQLSQRTKYQMREGEVVTLSGKIEATCLLSMSASMNARPQATFGEADGTGGSGFDEGDAFW